MQNNHNSTAFGALYISNRSDLTDLMQLTITIYSPTDYIQTLIQTKLLTIISIIRNAISILKANNN